jgi:hypothetical protein
MPSVSSPQGDTSCNPIRECGAPQGDSSCNPIRECGAPQGDTSCNPIRECGAPQGDSSPLTSQRQIFVLKLSEKMKEASMFAHRQSFPSHRTEMHR